ncbi:uncharacterized protein BDR25DRAFT_299441 [Lindgomyces ingoldianus]|uniref:Uncharacterized protein n=1 Tax=Lindgomyces ingoldianus TaxID=673940 RepID=A0ACB6REI2_9PLEO|nr:uncharacterized protein BDR25DRAFT_299441 [Lindgomyces ingoldianus]KAF2477527.1 hypothetical protein BDR25DRAFT_299441 [Lindgomyces ingoldianus]
MAEGERHGMVDLERELTCSICTDLLYQPLTLLDCLHTFCGACLKEWFQFQASTATSIHPYTCPSCRASVRTTQPNATVTTLLDMFVKTNPEKGKSDAEKKEAREKYKPGDNVLPKLRRREDPGAEEDRRLMEEVQQMSLREVGIPASTNTLEPPRERRRQRSQERSQERGQESRHRDREGGRSRSRNPPEVPSASRTQVVPPRHIEHQSSLRSLLSASELDSQEMEEEIMRQIMEEGLLDGIDLNNIDVAQEDEISERIAQAYRRRQASRQRERRDRRERLVRESRIESSTSTPVIPQEVRSPSVREEEQPRRRPHGRSESGTSTPQNLPSSRPPVSRPGLIEAANQYNRTHRRRSSSQGSSRSARRAERPTSLTVTSTRQAAHSASELGERPTTSENVNSNGRRRSDNQRRSTLEERQQFRNSLQPHSSSNPNSPRRPAFNVPTSESPSASAAILTSPVSSPPISSPPTSAHPLTSRRTTDPTHARQPRPINNGAPPVSSPPPFPRSTTDPSALEHHSRASSTVSVVTPTLYAEPQISCNRCGKAHIEYELHYNCSRCDRGEFNLCLNCYRAGKGCKHWYGFGRAAWPKYEKLAPPSGYPVNYEHPHILIGHRYRRSYSPLLESALTPGVMMIDDDPARRLESGVFCDMCKAFTNACYWKCDFCNEGDWGFCNDCVNQGRHCTHPLLPIAHKARESISNTTEPTSCTPSSPRPETSHRAGPMSPGLAPPSLDSVPTTPPLTPKTASLIRGPGLITIANMIFRPLTFTTICNICTYPIPPSHTRYHCPKCNKGDYDICMSCYHKLVSSGRISKDDGINGWRRCLRSHRMIVVGFEDRDGGQRRVVVRDLVGGFTLRDEEVVEPRSPMGAGGREGSSSSLVPALSSSQLPLQNWSWRDTDGSVHRYSKSPVQSPNPNINPSSAVTAPRYPPDGGMGLRVQALWSYFPGEGVEDELGFPKNAEIREVEDINGDWFWGVYAGCKGLFPGNYGAVVGG